MPRFIAFEGIDGSGKAVQIDMMEKHLMGEGKVVCKRSFPKYDGGFFGVEIGRLQQPPRSLRNPEESSSCQSKKLINPCR